MLTLLVSIISGGLAGGIVSANSNRIFHWRALRTQFYPKRGSGRRLGRGERLAEIVRGHE